MIKETVLEKTMLEEINLLLKFDRGSTQQGIKLHSDASEPSLAAAGSLYNKGLISQRDGGYLTDRGIEAAVHCEHLVDLLSD